MRPSDRTIRDVLRREAASVPIPDDMWKNISKELDRDAAVSARHKQLVRQGGQWRPALILAVAAGFFWFALIPALPNMDTTFPKETSTPAAWVPSGRPDPVNTPAKASTDTPRRDLRESVPANNETALNVVAIPPYYQRPQ